MKIALVQSCIMWENKGQNEAIAIEYIIQAASLGAEAIFFPEMSLTGFSMNTKITAEKNEETLNKFRKIAVKYNTAIGIGWVRQGKELAENHYTIIDKQGKDLSDYVKIHPFSYAEEDKYFVKGNVITYFNLGGYNWSNFICYDLRFPEIFQIASKTAEVILVSANWPRAREEHWKCLLRARAIENQCFILGVNCVGRSNDIEYSGGSCGISPDGEIINTLEKIPGIIIIDLKEDVKKMRRNFPVKKDRQLGLYISEYRRQ